MTLPSLSSIQATFTLIFVFNSILVYLSYTPHLVWSQLVRWDYNIFLHDMFETSDKSFLLFHRENGEDSSDDFFQLQVSNLLQVWSYICPLSLGWLLSLSSLWAPSVFLSSPRAPVKVTSPAHHFDSAKVSCKVFILKIESFLSSSSPFYFKPTYSFFISSPLILNENSATPTGNMRNLGSDFCLLVWFLFSNTYYFYYKSLTFYFSLT